MRQDAGLPLLYDRPKRYEQRSQNPTTKGAKLDAINPGDTAWVLVSAALVLAMTPALAFFYGGMVRKKNIVSTLNLSLMSLVGVQWVLFGYSLAFGSDLGGLIGGLGYVGLGGVGASPSSYASTVPHLAFAAFQMMFAIITPALITGAFVERIRFKTFLVFSLLWTTLAYDPVCHWVWGEGGILRNMGALDFAGGTVVHILAGFVVTFVLAKLLHRAMGLCVTISEEEVGLDISEHGERAYV